MKVSRADSYRPRSPVYVLVKSRENMTRCAQISDQASGNERLAVAGEDLLERPEISLW